MGASTWEGSRLAAHATIEPPQAITTCTCALLLEHPPLSFSKLLPLRDAGRSWEGQSRWVRGCAMQACQAWSTNSPIHNNPMTTPLKSMRQGQLLGPSRLWALHASMQAWPHAQRPSKPALPAVGHAIGDRAGVVASRLHLARAQVCDAREGGRCVGGVDGHSPVASHPQESVQRKATRLGAVDLQVQRLQMRMNAERFVGAQP